MKGINCSYVFPKNKSSRILLFWTKKLFRMIVAVVSGGKLVLNIIKNESA